MADSVLMAKPRCVKKVSKPLMEKKRRARINKCLNQLKSLLENVCSNSIRKRKLEKADILELTVKHLQNSERGVQASVCESAEYHAGYRSCLATVSRYVLSSDSDRDSSRFTTSGPQHTRAPESRDLAPTLQPSHTLSLKTDAPHPSLLQTSHRNYWKRVETCDMDNISFDAQVGTSESQKLKTIHFSFENAKVDECCSLKHSYWRPW